MDFITGTPLPLLVIFMSLFYFMILRPQQQRAKAAADARSAAIQRGDTVVLSNGVIGKVTKVEDKELGVEIATGVDGQGGARHGLRRAQQDDVPAAANDPAPKPALKKG